MCFSKASQDKTYPSPTLNPQGNTFLSFQQTFKKNPLRDMIFKQVSYDKTGIIKAEVCIT